MPEKGREPRSSTGVETSGSRPPERAPIGQPTGVTFPQIARLELDQLLEQLIDRAQEVLRTQGRLRGLLAATRSVAADLTLPVLLRRITEAACDLVGARYGALGVIGAGGGVTELITVGVDEQLVDEVGHLPHGEGILGLLISDPRPLRLQDLSQHPESVGFPPGHPPMRSFLGVPVRVRDQVFGNLYLTEKTGADVFSADDEELLSALAAAAGVAIDNARLFESSQRRQRWLEVSAEVVRELVAGAADPLLLVASRARQVADADLAVVLVPDTDNPKSLRVAAVDGDAADILRREVVPRDASLAGQVLREDRDMILDDALAMGVARVRPGVPAGPAALVRVPGVANGQSGVLCLTRARRGRRFDDEERDVIAVFAGHAALAIQFAQAEETQRQLLVFDDRERIARDLHDRVLRDLFTVELGLDSLTSRVADPAIRHQLVQLGDIVDGTIRATRDTVFPAARTSADDLEQGPTTPLSPGL